MSASHSYQYDDDASQDQDTASVTIKIAGLDVTVPAKFAAGQELTETQAKILDTAYQRQFYNNQTAVAKARAERYAAATTDAELLANAPLSAEDFAELYETYEPNVGRLPRGSSVENLRNSAAWQAWSEVTAEHNRSVAAGHGPVIVRAGNAPVVLMTAPRKARGKSETAHEAALADFASAKEALIEKLLASPVYADRIQTILDTMTAEAGAKKAGSSVTIAGADLV